MDIPAANDDSLTRLQPETETVTRGELIELIDIERLMKHDPATCEPEAEGLVYTDRNREAIFRCPVCAGKSRHRLNSIRRRVVCDGVGRVAVK